MGRRGRTPAEVVAREANAALALSWLLVCIGCALLGAAVLFTGCSDERPPVSALDCIASSQCIERWGDFAPVCFEGMCSQCATDQDCARRGPPSTCEPNAQGFGTCVPVDPDGAA